MVATPRKISNRICVVCKTTSVPKGKWRSLHSEAGKKKNLAGLLQWYGDIVFIEGYLCYNCERHLLNIEKLVGELKSKIHSNLTNLSTKRCLIDQQENIHDQKRTPKSLFGKDNSEDLILEPVAVTSTPVPLRYKKPDLNISSIVPSCEFPASLSSEPDFASFCLSEHGYTTSYDQSDSLPSNSDYVDICGEHSYAQSELASEKTSGFVDVSSEHSYARSESVSAKASRFVDSYTQSESVSVATSGSVNISCEHSYAQRDELQSESGTTVPKTKKVKKNIENHTVSFVAKHIISSSDKSKDENLSEVECSELLSILPKRSANELVSFMLSIPKIKNLVVSELCSNLSNEHKILKNRKKNPMSILMTKDYDHLKNFNWNDIVHEVFSEFPVLARMLLAFMLPNRLNEMNKRARLSSLIPRLGLIYSVLAQGRMTELSKVQRTISMLLFDNICDQKVFDRLQPLGLCLSYSHSIRILDGLSLTYRKPVVDALKEGNRIRIVGDNINWRTGVHDERQDNHSHMHHAFGSAVIIQNTNFDHLSDSSPQQYYTNVPVETFLPSPEDYCDIKAEYGILIARVIRRLVPALAPLVEKVDKEIRGPYTDVMSQKNKVVSLPVLHYNEQKYEDVVKIMEYYEDFLETCYEEAEKDLKKIHVGGDQLTRERFSGAKRLRTGGCTEKEQFHHLSPITFELFHLLMNYMKLIFKQLYKCGSDVDVGTMKCQQNRIMRTSVSENVNEHYDQDKDFFVSFVDSYIVEAVLDYFGMEDVYSCPTENIPPDFDSANEKCQWMKDMLGRIVEKYVWNQDQRQDDNVQEEGMVLKVKLADGSIKSIMLRKVPPKEDHVKNYGHLVLDIGLLFKSLLDMCSMPDRDRGLRLLKVAMVHFKANNDLSKYAYEIMRLLVHQYCLLSEKEAHEEFYGLFVNTKGKADSNIPCDLQMEYIVKEVKKNIKHMFSNKTEHNITSRTSALPALKEISKNFDVASDIIIRAKKHSDKDAFKDEMDLISDLRDVRPFKFQPGRLHSAFGKVHSSVSAKLNVEHLHSWVSFQKYKFATEKGN